MLGGIDPIIIIQISKLAGTAFARGVAKIPVVSTIPTLIPMPPIPIYLSQRLTGLHIDTEDKQTDFETDVETKSDGSEPEVNQKGTSSNVTISLEGNKDSIGIVLLSTLVDFIFDKATSKEYSITYIHGATTIFRAVLQSFAVEQSAENTKIKIKIILGKGKKTPLPLPNIPVVSKSLGAIPL